MNPITLTAMTRKLILLALIGTALHTQAQQARIVVQHAGNVQVFSDLTEAITAANPNAELFLGGGSYTLPAGFALSKTLHLIGAGIHPDSSGATGSTIICGGNSFRLMSSASGSSFTGIWFNMTGINTSFQFGIGPEDQTVESVEFHRCRFQQNVNLGAVEPAAGSAQFVECVFHLQVNGYGSEGHFSRCIFDWVPSTSTGTINIFRPGGLYLNNSVILGGLIGNCEGATIQNCAFTRQNGAPFWQGNTSTISNCLIGYSDLTSNSPPSVVGSNNIMNVAIGTFFQNEGDDSFQFTDNLRLQAGSSGVGAGTDGTDIGIYGTDSPYKDGAMPHTPHFRRVDVAPGTDASGNLPVQVKVAAQAN